MDGFSKDYTSSTPIKPNSPFQGIDVKKLTEELDFKLKLAHNKRLAIKDFISTTKSSASRTSVPEKKKMAERNKTQTLDERKHYLPRSFSFDSKDSILAVDPHDDIKNSFRFDSPLQPYDPFKNHLSPRPKYLMYNPDRRRQIFDRQKNVTRVRRSASYDAGLRFPDEELESNVEISTPENSVEETDVFDTEDEKEHEREKEEEKDEQFDDFEDRNGWNSKTLLQYLLVIIVLIVTTLAIISVKSPTVSSPTKDAMRGFMNLYTKTYGCFCRSIGFNYSDVGKWSKRDIGVDHDNGIWRKFVGDRNVDTNQFEGFKPAKKIEKVQNEIKDRVGIWSKNEIRQFQDSQKNKIEEKKEISHEIHKPVISKIEEIYSRLVGDDSKVEVGEEQKLLEKMVEADVGKEDIWNRLERFNPIYAVFIGVCVLILVSLSIIYYSKKSKISTPLKTTNSHKNSTSTNFFKSFVKSSPFTYSDEVSSSQTKSSYLEPSMDSLSYGSFTVEKKIVNKKKSKEPEVMLSPVRRSSRIYKRSVTSS